MQLMIENFVNHMLEASDFLSMSVWVKINPAIESDFASANCKIVFAKTYILCPILAMFILDTKVDNLQKITFSLKKNVTIYTTKLNKSSYFF